MAAKAQKKRKKTGGARSTSSARRRTGKSSNPATKIVVIGPRSKSNKGKGGHRPRGSRNPHFFGQNITPMQMGQYILGGLIGVTVNRVVLPLLPQQLIGTNIGASLTAFALAAGEWWLASMFDKNFGAAVGFGALMNASSQALNAFVPTVGSTLSLSGVRRGVNDFVPAMFTVPQNPILDAGTAGTGVSMRSAYPAAYALAA